MCVCFGAHASVHLARRTFLISCASGFSQVTICQGRGPFVEEGDHQLLREDRRLFVKRGVKGGGPVKLTHLGSLSPVSVHGCWPLLDRKSVV